MIYIFHHKSKEFQKFQTYKSLVKNHIGWKVKTLRSNNGGEYASNDFKRFCETCRIYNNILHHIPLNKMVVLSAKIEPWLNLHITCSNLQIYQIHCGVKLLQLHVSYKMFHSFQPWMKKLLMKRR
jgi:hypothetical protein